MKDITRLMLEQMDVWTAADTEKKSGRGRAAAGAAVYGVKKLRELILELAVRGKLVAQDPSEEPASELLKRIALEKARLVANRTIRKGQPLSLIDESEQPYPLPIGWLWVRLGTIGDWGAGATPARNNPEYYGGTIPWFKSGELTADFIETAEESITEKALAECSLRLNQSGDVLLAMYGATIGKTTILKIAATTNQAVCACTPFTGVFNQYLLVLLKAMKAGFIGQGAGGAQPNISREKIIATVAALPPANEQHRIVAKVDELMALCDQLETHQSNTAQAHEQLVSELLNTLTLSQDAQDFSRNWQRIATHFDELFTTEASIDLLKQTVLQLAVMGKLVEQDPDDEPASEVLRRVRLERDQMISKGILKKGKQLPVIDDSEELFGLPNSWCWVQFDHIAENAPNALKAGPFGSALKKDMYCETGYKIYGQEQVISGDENFGDYFIAAEKYQTLSSCAVKAGDLLISLVGTIGRVLTLSEHCKPGIINPRLVKISLYKEVDRKFMKIIFASPLLRRELENKSHGGTMDILNLGLLRDLILPFPPIEEQARIVAKVEELMSICDNLKARIQSATQLQQTLADALVAQALI